MPKTLPERKNDTSQNQDPLRSSQSVSRSKDFATNVLAGLQLTCGCNIYDASPIGIFPEQALRYSNLLSTVRTHNVY